MVQWRCKQSDLVLIQMMDGHSMKTIDVEVDLIRQLSGQDDNTGSGTKEIIFVIRSFERQRDLRG